MYVLRRDTLYIKRNYDVNEDVFFQTLFFYVIVSTYFKYEEEFFMSVLYQSNVVLINLYKKLYGPILESTSTRTKILKKKIPKF
jgi:hypothetical protein